MPAEGKGGAWLVTYGNKKCARVRAQGLHSLNIVVTIIKGKSCDDQPAQSR